MSLHDARDIIDWMTKEDGQQRAEWVVKEGKGSSAWIYWRRPEEWAEVLSSWVEETGQKSTVLTLYELTNGEATASQGLFSHVTKNSNEGTDQATEFYGMDADILHKSLSILVKRGRAQVFGAEDQRGVKFF
ncbi:hypothetical protein MMC12_000308 [Toensbergia leucococca]|nr:hypothetical protein [Toensbergia leucococca]